MHRMQSSVPFGYRLRLASVGVGKCMRAVRVPVSINPETPEVRGVSVQEARECAGAVFAQVQTRLLSDTL